MWQALAFLFEEDLGKAEVPARLLLSGAWPARWGPGGEGGAHWDGPARWRQRPTSAAALPWLKAALLGVVTPAWGRRDR